VFHQKNEKMRNLILTVLLVLLSIKSVSLANIGIDETDLIIAFEVQLKEMIVKPIDKLELLYLSRIMNAEAGDEFLNAFAVGNVIINKAENRNKSIIRTITEPGYLDGYKSKRFWYKPLPEHFKMAEILLKGYKFLPKTVEYFHNPHKDKYGRWISTDREWVEYIEKFTYRDFESHRFCHNPKLN
jgi:hypothetical protein